jgi:hypothetical protein
MFVVFAVFYSYRKWTKEDVLSNKNRLITLLLKHHFGLYIWTKMKEKL